MKSNAKYQPFPAIKLDDRMWPSRTRVKAPRWCSVDLRDGNQALATPMDVEQKLEMFEMIVKCGFKEIEVGFPAASPTEYEFVRRLIEEGRIPKDVTIQVLMQAREDLIKQTIDSLVGAQRAIIHLYNSTSPAQREIVFGMSKEQIVELAIQGTKWVKQYASKLEAGGTDVHFQYSPESFSATEIEFSLQVCTAVITEWNPTEEKKMIINLPETVQVAMPNVYADQIEWFCRNVARRDHVIISIHTHNDRGTGVASTELAMLAGGERVEGTLFGNGERTGNLDIIIVALNLFTQGIDPELDFSEIDRLREVYERCTGMTVHDRHPYSGNLVFTAFSGSHQDAIRKGLRAMGQSESDNRERVWNVPYLTIDPRDLGRTYSEVIRVNSQSGKGGIGHLLEQACGIHLPKDFLREFGAIAGKLIDALKREVGAEELKAMLWNEYIEPRGHFELEAFLSVSENGRCRCQAIIERHGAAYELAGEGNGPIDAFINALHLKGLADVEVIDMSEHALSEGSKASAISYIQLRFPDGTIRWGAGVDSSTQDASIKAIVSALNRE